jgi:hypothetical protein
MKSLIRHSLRALSRPQVLSSVLLASALALSMGTPAHAESPKFIAFESGQVRPLALSADGSRLFAVNTPNGTLDVFTVTATGLALQARVPVGLEPVAVALRNDNEVWVVNHLSDSVSVVSLDGVPHVTRTLLVGDEPRDIVFAGSPARASSPPRTAASNAPILLWLPCPARVTPS